MNLFVFSLITIVYLLPVNKGNYIELLNDDIEQNIDLNPQTRKLLNKINIFVYKHSKPSRKSFNDMPAFAESELRTIIKGRELKHYLTPNEIHEMKVNEVCKFIKNHYLSADYFFDEMERISSTREVKDNIRNMVAFFDKHPNLKPKILQAYREIRKSIRVPIDIWGLKTNNLVATLDASRFH